jgi:hypothetical protein
MELKYHIRKRWDDPKSQIGIDYNYLINAQKACDKLEGYFVFDSNGVQVYPEPILKEDDYIQLAQGAKFISGNDVAGKFIGMKLQINKVVNNNYEIKTLEGNIVGTVRAEGVTPYSEVGAATINPYYVVVTADNAFIHLEPKADARIIDNVPQHSFYKIINEHEDWCKLEVGFGWINAKDVKRVGK